MSDNQGVVRVSARPGAEPQIVGESPADATTQNAPSVQINADTDSVYSVSGDDVTVKGPVAVSSRVEFPSGSGVLATAHTVNGRPIPPHGITDRTLVYYTDADGNRLETEVSALVSAGVLSRSPDGRGYVEVQQQQQAEAQQQKAGPAAFPPGHEKAEELYQLLAAKMPEAVANKLLVRVMNGTIDEAFAHDLGAEVGANAEIVKHDLNSLAKAFAASAAAAMQQAGVAPGDIEDAYAYAWEKHPARMEEANIRLVMARDPRVYVAIAEAYLRDNPPSREAVERAGLKPYLGSDGKTLMIRVHGMEMPVAAAARNGWL